MKPKTVNIDVEIAIYEHEKWINEDCLTNTSKSLFNYIPLTHIKVLQIKRDDFLRKILKFSVGTITFFKVSSSFKKILHETRIDCKENTKIKPIEEYNNKALFRNMSELALHFPNCVKKIYDTKDIEDFYQVIL